MADGNDVVYADQPCKVLESLLPPSPTWYTSYGCDGNEIGVFVCASRNHLNVFKVNNLTTAAEQAVDSGVASMSNELISYNLLASLSHVEKVHVTALGPRHRIAKDDDLVLAVACCDDGTVHLWDVFSQKEIQYHDKHKSKVTAAAWSLSEPDFVITGDERGFIALFKFDTNCSLKLHHPEKCQVSCMTFSPHNLDLLAVGYKSGNIILMNVSTTSLTVVKKFPGHHDDITSLVWCPQPGEQFCAQKPNEAETDTNTESCPTTETGHLFASGSKDQKICVWSTKKDYCLTSMSLPNNVGMKREKSSETMRLWVALHWPRKHPHTLVSSVYSGVMLKWDLSYPGKKKFVIFSAASNCSHNRIVFNIASLGLDHNILLTNSQDRNMILWDVDKCKSIHVVSTFGGFVYDVHAVPLDPGRIALGIGDNTIRIWNRTKDSNRFLVQIWQKIKSKVTVVRWHPTYEGLLAYGTDDGRVATVEVNSHKPPSICPSYHSKTVYCLDWGKPTYKAGSTNTNRSLYNLYSQGENTILQHYINSSEPATNVNHIIQHTNGKNDSGTFPNRTEIRWSPDFSLVAIGNIDGSVEIFLPPHLQLLCTINIFSKIINCISWHPLYTTSYNMMSTCSNWLAIGSNDSVVHVVDLTIVIKEKVSDSNEIVIITESLRSLEGHSKRITGLCWSTHNEGHLVTISYDKTAVVWDVKKGEALAHYRGHSGRLMCVSWSLTDPNLIYTGSDDCFLHGWRMSAHHCQPKLNIKKSVKVKKRSTAKKAGGSVASAVTTLEKNKELVGNKERSSSPSTELSDVQLGIETGDSISSSNKTVLATEASQNHDVDLASMLVRSVGDQVACRFPEVSVANHKTIRIAELQHHGSLLIAGTITVASMYAMEAPSMSSNMPIEVTSHKEKVPVVRQ
ncbi:gem-associated protein 5 [Octopus vulgaris]|uniref:Gem-associated protein 5 n=1 Tax=Octopus vulgaris TaxID=6645 RepID=A0AA36FEI7_OCTVU|nr:gem-associated protein 5 [Octopus vulgaris]